ncbi:MAG: alpha/beta hydrolase [Thermoplasmata archaeon]
MQKKRTLMKGCKTLAKKSYDPLIFLCTFLLILPIIGPISTGADRGYVLPSDEDTEAVDRYLQDPLYDAMPEALEALESDDVVIVTDNEDEIIFEPADGEYDIGAIIYPGGSVDHRAYAPGARAIAAQGYFVAILYFRFQPIFNPEKAGDVMDAYPEMEYWSIGGHSLGGVAAGTFYGEGRADGLFFWASYPSDDLSDEEGEFLSVYGDRDGLTTLEDIEDSKGNLSEDTVFAEIVGGNHAQFGYYGPQDGDNEANITREVQHEIMVNETLTHLAKIGGCQLRISTGGEGTTDPEVGIHRHEYEDEVMLTAYPEPGWVFSRWSGDLSGTDEQITITMDRSKTVVANFTEEGVSTKDIQLYAGGDAGGWNFVSFNLAPVDTDLEFLLEHAEYGISGFYEQVIYYDSSSGRWSSYIPGREEHFNSLQSWDNSMGAWIRVTGDVTLTVAGEEPVSTDITLEPGWNMVGMPGQGTGNHGLPEEVSCIGYFHGHEETNLAYTNEVTTFVFEPGEGYWLYNSASDTAVWTVEY